MRYKYFWSIAALPTFTETDQRSTSRYIGKGECVCLAKRPPPPSPYKEERVICAFQTTTTKRGMDVGMRAGACRRAVSPTTMSSSAVRRGRVADGDERRRAATSENQLAFNEHNGGTGLASSMIHARARARARPIIRSSVRRIASQGYYSQEGSDDWRPRPPPLRCSSVAARKNASASAASALPSARQGD